SVRQAAAVDMDFDPRRHARRRHYRYLIDNSPTRPAVDRDRVWHVAARLDVRAMADAAGRIVGEHDFAAFASPLEDEDASTVRRLESLTVMACRGRVRIDAVANAFLPHQVRRMTGALVEVGRGKLSPEEFGLLLSGPAGSAGPAAPARGLTLMGVDYALPLFD